MSAPEQMGQRCVHGFEPRAIGRDQPTLSLELGDRATQVELVGERVMTKQRRNQSLGEIAVKPTFRIIDGVSINTPRCTAAHPDARADGGRP